MPKVLANETTTSSTTPPATNEATTTPIQQSPEVHTTYTLAATLQSCPEAQDVPTYTNLGATNHFFVNQAAFTDYKELLNPIEG